MLNEYVLNKTLQNKQKTNEKKLQNISGTQ